jgi:nucleotide-binding universal stress UspA family protein
MKILLAYDGSAGAEEALALAGSLPWPSGSRIRVVAAVEPAVLLAAPPLQLGALLAAPELDADIMALHRAQVDEAVRMLSRDGLQAEGAVLPGRSGTVLVAEATRLEADLVIVGSRGYGPLASLVLGSVSAEVVDLAPCPVLVARTPRLTGLVLATDGSEAASDAERVLATWEVFEHLPMRVVSVAHVDAAWHSGIAPTLHGEAVRAYREELARARGERERIAEEAAARLRAAGRTADATVRSGDAAAEIVAEVAERGADLVVIGSRGRTGVTRIVLGSVARNVLHGSEAR